MVAIAPVDWTSRVSIAPIYLDAAYALGAELDVAIGSEPSLTPRWPLDTAVTADPSPAAFAG